MLFLRGDGPAGFETLLRKDGRDWIRRNATLLGAEDSPLRRVQVMALTSIVGDAASEISSLADGDEAQEMIAATLAMLRTVATT